MFVIFDGDVGAVGGASVNDDMLNIVEGLVNDAEDSFSEEFFAVDDQCVDDD